MKKLLYTFVCCTLLLAGCSKDEPGETPQVCPPVIEYSGFMSPSHFYGAATAEILSKGTAQRDNLWYVGTTITVKFLNDPFDMADQIKTWAREWEQYANIAFDFVEPSEDANIRIGFDWSDNRWITWSYIGTDCKMVTDQNDATMSFAFWQYATEQEKKGDVLRAFGQVLGLELEHRHLEFDPGWRTEARIQAYWEGEIEDIPWEQLKLYVFEPLDRANTIQSEEYDPLSIMIWPFANSYATNTERDFNYELSDTDKAFIASVYPRKPWDKNLLAVFTGDHNGIVLRFLNREPIIVEYNEKRDTIAAVPSPDYYFNQYSTLSEEKNPIVKIYGSENAVTMLYLDDMVSVFDITRCTGLESLELFYMAISDADLSGNPQLNNLQISGTTIMDLDLSHNENLELLYVHASPMQRVDLSHNKKLTRFTFNISALNALDLSNNPLINNIYIATEPIIHDEQAMLLLAESLPDRTDQERSGLLDVRNATTESWIESICTAKNWTFTYVP